MHKLEKSGWSYNYEAEPWFQLWFFSKY